MTESFNVQKHRLTKAGEPWKVGKGGYMPLKEGEKNDPSLVAKFFAAPKQLNINMGSAESKAATAAVYDASTAGLDNNLNPTEVQQNTSKLILSQDEIKAMENQIADENTVTYKFFDRKLDQYVVSKYNITQLMNQLESIVNPAGGKLWLENDGFGGKLLYAENSFGAKICLNTSQPPAIIEREVRKNCMIKSARVHREDGNAPVQVQSDYV